MPSKNTNPNKPRWTLAAAALAFLALASICPAQSNSDLSSLVPSAGTLDPVFDSATIDYTAAVPFATTSITVTTIAVISGNASDPLHRSPYDSRSPHSPDIPHH